jgi:hypothetical protein
MDIHFFELPVYRIAEKKYYKIKDDDIAAQISHLERRVPGYRVSESMQVNIDQHWHERYGPWRFNEIIGYIRLHFLGSQIRGEYFSAEKKRNPISRKKVFLYRTHKLAIELSLMPPRPRTNAEIFAAVKQYVDNCRRELPKGRVIDDAILMTIGPFVDWLALSRLATEPTLTRDARASHAAA